MSTEIRADRDHDITLDAAAKLTKKYRSIGTIVPSLGVLIKGEFFGKNAMVEILNQNGCVGLRMYYGADDLLVPHMVIVGVDANGDDQVTGKIAEHSMLCPPACGTLNKLNSDI